MNYTVVSLDEEEGIRLLTIRGELDLTTVQELDLWLQETPALPTILDLSEMGFVDSTGVRFMLSLWRKLVWEERVRLVLCGVPGRIRDLHDLVGLDQVLEYAPTQEAALAMVRREGPR